MTDDDSLKDVVQDVGGSQLAAAIDKEFGEQLNQQLGPAGKPFEDLNEVGYSFRKYDHGQASDRVVTETGVKAEFDPDKTRLNSLKEGGKIRRRLHDLATKHLTCDLEYIEVTFVTEDKYEVWIVSARDEIPIE